MVGVPRSKGCQSCVRRRIKCDERRPLCRRCEIRGLQCPGYEKPREFRHFSIDNGGSWQDVIPSPSQSSASASVSGDDSRVKEINDTNDEPISTMDQYVAPTLVQRSMSIQQKELFCDFVDIAFPGLYYSWSTRVEVNFMDFVRQQSDNSTNALVWAASTLCTVNRGQMHRDSHQVDLGRAMYIRGIQCLIRLIQNPRTVKSDQTLGIAVLLAICEMIDGSFQQSWLAHTSGIAALFRHRGPEAHRDGVGKTLLISFRSFIVADALLRGEPCFLAEPAWRSIIIQTMKDENESGKGSELGDLVEFAFHEVTLCPGLVARVREMLMAKKHDIIQEKLLIKALSGQSLRLSKLHGRLSVLLAEGTALEDKPEIIGPIPHAVVHTLAKSTLQGLSMAMMLLDRLSKSLESHQTSYLLDGSYLEGKFSQPSPAKDRIIGQKLAESPDHLALTMGMLVLKK